jgi:hypothetical protein
MDEVDKAAHDSMKKEKYAFRPGPHGMEYAEDNVIGRTKSITRTDKPLRDLYDKSEKVIGFEPVPAEAGVSSGVSSKRSSYIVHSENGTAIIDKRYLDHFRKGAEMKLSGDSSPIFLEKDGYVYAIAPKYSEKNLEMLRLQYKKKHGVSLREEDESALKRMEGREREQKEEENNTKEYEEMKKEPRNKPMTDDEKVAEYRARTKVVHVSDEENRNGLFTVYTQPKAMPGEEPYWRVERTYTLKSAADEAAERLKKEGKTVKVEERVYGKKYGTRNETLEPKKK